MVDGISIRIGADVDEARLSGVIPGGAGGVAIDRLPRTGSFGVYVATRPVDFRKGMDGLALAVQEIDGA